MVGGGPNSGANHPTTATSGGASAKPTPANNTGGGSGWGYLGFVKGGTTETADTGSGHVTVCGGFYNYFERVVRS